MKFTCTITSINEIVIVLKQNAQTVTMSAIVNTGCKIQYDVNTFTFTVALQVVAKRICYFLTRVCYICAPSNNLRS